MTKQKVEEDNTGAAAHETKMKMKMKNYNNNNNHSVQPVGVDHFAESVSAWTTEHVASWLMENNLSEYVNIFRTNKIDGDVLLSLEESDLRSPLMGIKAVGDMKRMVYHLKQLKEEALIDGLYMSNIRYASNYHWKSDAFWKFMAGAIYMGVVSFCTAITMAIVHDRVPDTDTYPPLVCTQSIIANITLPRIQQFN
jgi:hypothetical protein